MTRSLSRWIGALYTACFCISVFAQTSAPIRLIVPFNPGGGSDLFARLVAPGLTEILGQPVIVENRPGAGGIIGADYVVKSPPDGRTLLVSDSAAYSISPSLYPALPYATKDLIPVADLGRFANVLVVSASSPFSKLEELIQAARNDPGKLTIASAGNGSSPHLTAEKFQVDAKIKLVHVPYKGSGPAISDTLGGQVDMVFTGLPSVIEYIKAGKLKAIAIASAQRSPYAPEVRTMSEAGVTGFESLISQGLFAPAGTPVEVVNNLNGAVNKFMNSQEMAARLQQLKVVPASFSSKQYQDWLSEQSMAWATLIRQASIKIE